MPDETRVFRKVMVPLDGSPLAERALVPAAKLAERAGAQLLLVTVKPPASTVRLPPESRRAHERVDDFLEKRLRGYLAAQVAALPATMSHPVQIAVLDGWAPESLAAHAHAADIDLIIMTTHGRGGASRFWLGSVADELLRRTSCPVLLLREGGAGADGEFQRILVALDGSLLSEALLPPALAIAALHKEGRCTLVHVVEPPPSLLFRMAGLSSLAGQRWTDDQRESATSHFAHLADRLRHSGVPAEVRVVVGEGVGEHIVSVIEEVHNDLTVVGTYGARGLERIVLGSVADKVVRGSAAAVLVVPLWHVSGESRTVARPR
ncbi:MAG: universal stress protein [Gemmatimonadales bacterium]